MATTTNYSWTTPDDTALVKDGAAAIRSLGTAIDSTVFTNAGAAIAKAIVDAKGDIIAATAADTVARLAVGANDTILTADSSTATGLKWAAPSVSKVVQIIYASTSTAATTTSSTFSDTNLTGTITPTSASNKVLVFVQQNGLFKNGNTHMQLKLFRGATEIIKFGRDIGLQNASTVLGVGGAGVAILDTPATTSATTYKTQFNSVANDANTTTCQVSSDAASTIILMEVTP